MWLAVALLSAHATRTVNAEDPANGDTAAPKHWAFQPVSDPSPPDAAGDGQPGDRARNEVDRFVLARLADAQLALSAEADRRALIRRVTIDLIGLPPTIAEVDAFLDDDSDDAFDRVVDRLLASPRYGERWGRHWLDIARYADTKGYVFTAERRFPYSYTYRDYVARSLNEDLPYDRFIVEQMAADRLDLGDDPRPLAALGFLTLGRRFLNNVHDIIDDRIDVVTRGLLALTVQCARCHDHKYDPIPAADYYSLYGVFASSTEPKELPTIGPPENRELHDAFKKELEKTRQAVETFRRRKHVELQGELRTTTPKYLIAVVTGEKEAPADFGLSLGKGELRGPVLTRWKSYLQRRAKPEDPVFGPWHTLLGADDLPGRARTLVDTWKAGAGGTGVNPRIRDAITARPPQSRLDVARVYSEVFLAALDNKPEKATKDEAAEEIRAVLHADEAPPSVTIEKSSKLFSSATRSELRELQKKVEKLQVEHAGAPARGMTLVDTPRPHDPRVFRRGKPGDLGEAIPRRFLAAISPGERQPFRDGSGRLDLARAIVDPRNPLTARVIVNRVWRHLLGRGIVRTPSDFGLRSDPPTHPQLLDWLARRLIEDGWSLKLLQRRILLSATYRQSSSFDPRSHGIDPNNLLLWRINPRRVEFEVLRDSLLHAAGRLDTRIGGKSVDIFRKPFSPRRTVYGFIDRQNLPGTLRTFDFASPDATSPKRHETTVPQQALWLMNSPFAREQAAAVIAQPDIAAITDPRQRIDRLFRGIFGRPPEAFEVASGVAYLGPSPAVGMWQRYVQTLFLSNEFAFVD